MKQIVFTAVALLLFIANIEAQTKAEPVFPKIPFDKAAAMKMLEPGTSSITGVIKKKIKNQANTFLGIEVTLLPVTPYVSEWIELRKQYKKGKKIASMSQEAYSYRILAKADDNTGVYTFRNIKPGKYYLMTTVTVGKAKDMLIQTGTSTTTGYNVFGQAVNSRTDPIYAPFKLFYNDTDFIADFAEVTADGQIVKLDL